MATRTEVVTFDDFNGEAGAERIEFGYLGVDYEIDLDKVNADRLARVLAPFLEKARRQTTVRGTVRRRSTASRTGPDPVAVRAWARDNDIHVPARGRIPKAVIDRFMAEHTPAF